MQSVSTHLVICYKRNGVFHIRELNVVLMQLLLCFQWYTERFSHIQFVHRSSFPCKLHPTCKKYHNNEYLMLILRTKMVGGTTFFAFQTWLWSWKRQSHRILHACIIIIHNLSWLVKDSCLNNISENLSFSVP